MTISAVTPHYKSFFLETSFATMLQAILMEEKAKRAMAELLAEYQVVKFALVL